MDQYLLLNPALSREDIEKLLENYPARRLGQFSEPEEIFSAWEIIDENEAVYEFELHSKFLGDINYLCLRDNLPLPLLEWLNQQHLLANTEVVSEFLNDPRPETRMRGLVMVALDPRPYFVNALFGLQNDSDPQVRQFALELFEQLFHMRPEQLGVPETHLQASVQDRRQLLRWVMQTPGPANSSVTQLISQSLKDSDWEVRVSAMIACARFQLTSLSSLVVAVTLPNLSVVTKRDVEIFHAIQKIVLFILSGKTPGFQPAAGVKQARWYKLYQLISGERSVISGSNSLDYIDAIIHYFTTPFPGHQHSPPFHPAVVSIHGKYYLAKTAIELCWVPAESYWRRDDSSEDIQVYKAQTSGFFISRYHYSEDDEYDNELPVDLIPEKINRLSNSLNVHLTLPTISQWLSSMSGTDARTYAWGWGLQNDWMLNPSPWGLMQPWSERGEWIFDNNQYQVVGVAGKSIHAVKTIGTETGSLSLPWRVVFTP